MSTTAADVAPAFAIRSHGIGVFIHKYLPMTRGRVLGLIGAAESGKTELAAQCAVSAVSNGLHVLFANLRHDDEPRERMQSARRRLSHDEQHRLILVAPGCAEFIVDRVWGWYSSKEPYVVILDDFSGIDGDAIEALDILSKSNAEDGAILVVVAEPHEPIVAHLPDRIEMARVEKGVNFRLIANGAQVYERTFE